MLAIDTEPVRVAGTRSRQVDPADPALAQALRGIDTAVYVAARTDLARELAEGRPRRRQRNLRRAQTVITAAAAAGVGHLVVVTSAKVYGARPDNPVPLEDDAPLRAVADAGIVGDLMDVEQLVAVARDVHPGLRLTVVRPAALVGRRRRHRHHPPLRGAPVADGEGVGTPAWQFCHVDDLGSAVAVVVGPPPRAGGDRGL